MEDTHIWQLGYLDEPESAFFAVFDGHAGFQCASYCHETLVGVLAKELKQGTPAPQALFNTFLTVDKQLEDQSIKNSGCTAAVAVVRQEPKGRGRRLYVGNVGDTRVILNRGGMALRLSYDHRGGDAYEGKRIHNAGGLLINGRVNGVLAVTRALGDLYMKEYVVGSPYTTETLLGTDDVQLIIACDGLWDVCSDQQAVDLIMNISDPTEASQVLLKYALDNFSTDNLTVMVVNLAHGRVGKAEGPREVQREESKGSRVSGNTTFSGAGSTKDEASGPGVSGGADGASEASEASGASGANGTNGANGAAGAPAADGADRADGESNEPLGEQRSEQTSGQTSGQTNGQTAQAANQPVNEQTENPTASS